jgi:hypothetical protein
MGLVAPAEGMARGEQFEKIEQIGRRDQTEKMEEGERVS